MVKKKQMVQITYVELAPLNSPSYSNIAVCSFAQLTPDFQTIALNYLAIRLRSEDLHHFILGNKVPENTGLAYFDIMKLCILLSFYCVLDLHCVIKSQSCLLLSVT